MSAYENNHSIAPVFHMTISLGHSRGDFDKQTKQKHEK